MRIPVICQKQKLSKLKKLSRRKLMARFKEVLSKSVEKSYIAIGNAFFLLLSLLISSVTGCLFWLRLFNPSKAMHFRILSFYLLIHNFQY